VLEFRHGCGPAALYVYKPNSCTKTARVRLSFDAVTIQWLLELSSAVVRWGKFIRAAGWGQGSSFKRQRTWKGQGVMCQWHVKVNWGLRFRYSNQRGSLRKCNGATAGASVFYIGLGRMGWWRPNTIASFSFFFFWESLEIHKEFEKNNKNMRPILLDP
jgi:hypothetical protein